jgi:hypothetical protein
MGWGSNTLRKNKMRKNMAQSSKKRKFWPALGVRERGD